VDAGMEIDFDDIARGFTVKDKDNDKSWSLKNLFSSRN